MSILSAGLILSLASSLWVGTEVNFKYNNLTVQSKIESRIESIVPETFNFTPDMVKYTLSIDFQVSKDFNLGLIESCTHSLDKSVAGIPVNDWTIYIKKTNFKTSIQ